MKVSVMACDVHTKFHENPLIGSEVNYDWKEAINAALCSTASEPVRFLTFMQP
jgi:hypothetical protein